MHAIWYIRKSRDVELADWSKIGVLQSYSKVEGYDRCRKFFLLNSDQFWSELDEVSDIISGICLFSWGNDQKSEFPIGSEGTRLRPSPESFSDQTPIEIDWSRAKLPESAIVFTSKENNSFLSIPTILLVSN